LVFAQELASGIKWGDPDEEGLVAFLVSEKNFSEDRVRKAVARIKGAKGKVVAADWHVLAVSV
jgi:hypothetical protein